uniref:F-box protein n=1 Tax=Noccaea caerulescens TaxID=107243 RepID=A0A1J3JU65_NOCCA
MDAPNPKRHCQAPSVTSSIENPSSLTPGFNQSNIDLTISSFLSLSDFSPFSIGCSFDRVLDKVIPSVVGTSGDDFDQDRFLDRTLQLASLLYKSTKRCIRKRATLQNFISWPLLPELTSKVFSMLDTKSLMQASACCTMFNKCAMDRVCYSHIDLTMAAKHVDNGVLCIMIHRAGKELRSLKLGSISRPAGSNSLLTRSCLAPLNFDHGFAGGLLRSLHLYNLTYMDYKSLCALLPACSNLTDLKIVGYVSGDINPLEQLASVTRNCRLIEHLFLDSHHFGRAPATDSNLVEFAYDCPNLTSLTLQRFVLNDAIARVIIKSFRQLKYISLLGTSGISGSFLRGLGLSCRDRPLETLILRNCCFLKEREVLLFLNSLLGGDFNSIRHIDISNRMGLVSDGGKRTVEPKFPIEELKKRRSGLTFVAIFPRRAPSSTSSSSTSTSTSTSSSSSSSGEVHSGGNSSGSSYYSSDEEEDEE